MDSSPPLPRRRDLLRRLLALGGLVLLTASLLGSCGRGRSGEPCYETADCPAEEGELKACVSGQCEGVDCLSSSDCPMGSICSVDSFDFECQEGCNSDADCLAGSTCQEGQCADYGCRSTVLDCDLGEFCNETTGECETAEGAYCSACQMASNDWNDQGTLTTCDDILLGNDSCGGVGSFCTDWITGEPT